MFSYAAVPQSGRPLVRGCRATSIVIAGATCLDVDQKIDSPIAPPAPATATAREFLCTLQQLRRHAFERCRRSWLLSAHACMLAGVVANGGQQQHAAAGRLARQPATRGQLGQQHGAALRQPSGIQPLFFLPAVQPCARAHQVAAQLDHAWSEAMLDVSARVQVVCCGPQRTLAAWATSRHLTRAAGACAAASAAAVAAVAARSLCGGGGGGADSDQDGRGGCRAPVARWVASRASFSTQLACGGFVCNLCTIRVRARLTVNPCNCCIPLLTTHS